LSRGKSFPGSPAQTRKQVRFRSKSGKRKRSISKAISTCSTSQRHRPVRERSEDEDQIAESRAVRKSCSDHTQVRSRTIERAKYTPWHKRCHARDRSTPRSFGREGRVSRSTGHPRCCGRDRLPILHAHCCVTKNRRDLSRHLLAQYLSIVLGFQSSHWVC